MSDIFSRNVPARRPRDRGMTLPELLIAVTVMGMIAAVLSSAIIVTIRQSDNTEGRVNVARAEQNVSMWLPADLASAAEVDTKPGASPCGATTCDGIDLSKGSNVLMLTWTTNDGSRDIVTVVSYHFRPNESGSYELLRVECVDGQCSSMIVLRDLPGPPGGEPFVAGVPHGAACLPDGTVPCTIPSWVIIVSQPLSADAVDENDPANQLLTPEQRKNANRVIVTINGGGDTQGAGGGINQISITAGGTYRNTIESSSLQGAPTFTQAMSLCGGPMTLVIDESNSIGDSITQVRDGVRAFITALAGTPVKLQVVRFQTYSEILASSQWQQYFDMTKTEDVNALLGAVDNLRGDWAGVPGPARQGGTNWEEALFRTFYNADGTVSSVIPETVVFFTDGVPTFDRLVYRTSPGVLPAEPPAPVAPWPASTGSSYSQVGFNRANFIANAFRRSVRFVGVGVGSGIQSSSNWILDPGAGYRMVWERGYRQYQRQSGQALEGNIDFEQSTNYESNMDFERAQTVQSNLDFERASTFQSNMDFERATAFESTVDYEEKVGSNWRDRTPTQYFTNNRTPDSTDNWRINSSPRSWYSVTETEFRNYRGSNTTAWRITGWSDATPTQYYGGNTTSDSWDGWRINGTRSSWYTVTQAEYAAYASLSASNWSIGGWGDVTPTQYYTGNTTPDQVDGWRINGTRSAWYAVTITEYNTYASLSPTNWTMSGWVDAASPTEYYTNNVNSSATDGWRINGNRSTWYVVTSTEFTTYASQSPANWRPGGWNDVTPAQYTTGNRTPDETDGWRINGARTTWYTVTQAEYDGGNTTPDETDGWRITPTYNWITTAEYETNNTTPDATDGFVDVGSPQYVTASLAQNWVEWPGTRSGDSTEYRQTKLYNSPPYTGFDPAVTTSTANKVILARLIAGNDVGVPALPVGGPYTNTDEADMYVLPNWTQFEGAMKDIALGECGGTLTVQTKVGGTAPARDPFTYQRAAITDSTGTVLNVPQTIVTTSQQFTAGTFDLPIESGRYVTVEIRPHDYSNLTAYTPNSWSCKAGVTNRTVEVVPLEGAWQGIRVQVAANEAVSCTLSVTKR